MAGWRLWMRLRVSPKERCSGRVSYLIRHIRGDTNLCDIKITREKPPVDVRPVPNVRIVVLGRGCLQHLLHERLVPSGLLEE